MTTERALQLSLVDGLERRVGAMPESVVFGDNAALVSAIAPAYLTGSVLDVTYGRGVWWRRFKPEPFAFHDIALDGVDFRRLPEASSSFETVCFDPPYIPTRSSTSRLEFRDRYGLNESRTHVELRELIADGIAEAARVTSRWLLVKCCDYVDGRMLNLGHLFVIERARELRLCVHDLIVHASASGPGPGGGRIREVTRARRAHSYLVVLRKTRVSLIGPERKRGSVTSTATTKRPAVHAHDTPAICDISGSAELGARGAEGELDGPRNVESASDGARWA